MNWELAEKIVIMIGGGAFLVGAVLIVTAFLFVILPIIVRMLK